MSYYLAARVGRVGGRVAGARPALRGRFGEGGGGGMNRAPMPGRQAGQACSPGLACGVSRPEPCSQQASCALPPQAPPCWAGCTCVVLLPPTQSPLLLSGPSRRTRRTGGWSARTTCAASSTARSSTGEAGRLQPRCAGCRACAVLARAAADAAQAGGLLPASPTSPPPLATLHRSAKSRTRAAWRSRWSRGGCACGRPRAAWSGARARRRRRRSEGAILGGR